MQSSITIIDNSTGDVVAIVGQFGEKTQNLLNNYANTAQRAAGLVLKAPVRLLPGPGAGQGLPHHGGGRLPL